MDSALGDAGFDLVHLFDAAIAAHEPGLAMLADGSRRLGLLVGNTRALWPPFVAARHTDPELAAARDPLDRYTEQSIGRAFPGAPIWFGHRRYDGAFVPLQRLAVATGLGALAPTQLVIHPIYGPWFALRAVVLVAGEPPPTAPIAAPCTCGASCHEALARALAARSWQAWLAVRDACPIGKAFRYSDEQIAYHYASNRSLHG